MPERSEDPPPSLDGLRERLLGVEARASVKSWFPRLRQTIARLAESEANLRRLNEELEAEIATRTRELQRTNEELASKNAKLEAALAELESSREALVQSERLAAVARLAGSIAHELNSPLGALLSSTSILVDVLAEAMGRLAASASVFTPREATVFRALLAAGSARVLANPERVARFDERLQLEDEIARRGLDTDIAVTLAELGLSPDSALLEKALAAPRAAQGAHSMVQALSSAAVAKRSGEKAAEVVRRLQRSVSEGFEVAGPT